MAQVQIVGFLVLVHMKEVRLFKFEPAHVLLRELDQGSLDLDPLVVRSVELLLDPFHVTLEDAARLTVLLHALDVARIETLSVRVIYYIGFSATLPQTSELCAELLATGKVGKHERLFQVEVHDACVLDAQFLKHFVHLFGHPLFVTSTQGGIFLRLELPQCEPVLLSNYRFVRRHSRGCVCLHDEAWWKSDDWLRQFKSAVHVLVGLLLVEVARQSLHWWVLVEGLLVGLSGL